MEKKALRSLVGHEVSPQWFSALVGNDQAEDPWPDETLATFGEAVVGGDDKDYGYHEISAKVVGLMGQPLTHWAGPGMVVLTL